MVFRLVFFSVLGENAVEKSKRLWLEQLDGLLAEVVLNFWKLFQDLRETLNCVVPDWVANLQISTDGAFLGRWRNVDGQGFFCWQDELKGGSKIEG